MGAETDALIKYMRDSGVPHRVTSTTGGKHAKTSRHYQDLAVDFAGPKAGRDSPEMLRIFNTLLKVERQLYELIYTPAGFSIKRGKRVTAYSQKLHYNHVHVSVDRGVIVRWPHAATPNVKVEPMFNPPIPMVAYLDAPAVGVWVLAQDGSIYALGGAQYLGGANDKDYFSGRKAARLEPHGDGYTIVAESGERYDYP